MNIEQLDSYSVSMTKKQLKMTKAIMSKFLIRDDGSDNNKLLVEHAESLVEAIESKFG